MIRPRGGPMPVYATDILASLRRFFRRFNPFRRR